MGQRIKLVNHDGSIDEFVCDDLRIGKSVVVFFETNLFDQEDNPIDVKIIPHANYSKLNISYFEESEHER